MTYKRYIIKPEERGKRPSLSNIEPTVIYLVRMPESLKEKALKLGPDRVRKLIESVEL